MSPPPYRPSNSHYMSHAESMIRRTDRENNSLIPRSGEEVRWECRSSRFTTKGSLKDRPASSGYLSPSSSFLVRKRQVSLALRVFFLQFGTLQQLRTTLLCLRPPRQLDSTSYAAAFPAAAAATVAATAFPPPRTHHH